MRHHDRVVDCLMNTGFSAALATHAFSVLDAYVYGFALTETSLPFTSMPGVEETFAGDAAPSMDDYRSLTQLPPLGGTERALYVSMCRNAERPGGSSVATLGCGEGTKGTP